MTDKEKIAKAIELLDSLGLKHEIMTIDDVYKGLRHETLEDIASTLMDVINTVYQIREALE